MAREVSTQVVDFPFIFNESSRFLQINIRKFMILRGLYLEKFVLLQVVGFSRVINVFRDFSSFFSRFSSCSTLIFRRLGLKQAVFEPFLTLNHLDFSSLTKKLPDFFAGGTCNQNLPGELFLAKDAKVPKAGGLR